MAKVNPDKYIHRMIQKKLGCYRESMIYSMAEDLRGQVKSWKLPRCYMALCDPETGRTCTVMEFIEGAHNLM